MAEIPGGTPPPSVFRFPSYLPGGELVPGHDQYHEVCCSPDRWNEATGMCTDFEQPYFGQVNVNPERQFVGGLEQNFPPTTTNVRPHLEKLAEIYQKALNNDKPNLARRCQILAMRYVRFAENSGMNRDELRPPVAPLGIHIPVIRKASVYIGHVTSLLVNNPGGTLRKISANVTAIDHDSKYATAKLERTPTTTPFQNGIRRELLRLYLDGTDEPPTTIGEMLIVPASSLSSMEYRVQEMNGPQARHQGWQVFSSANYSLDRNVPATVSVVQGTPHNLYDSGAEGLVVIRNGQPHIYHAREVGVSTMASEVIANGESMFQTHLIVHKGRNIVSADSSNDKDVRRVLVTFTDGAYAIIQINESVDLYELGGILSRIDGLQEAVNLDTGGGNVGGRITANGKYYPFGDGYDPDGDGFANDWDDAYFSAASFVGIK